MNFIKQSVKLSLVVFKSRLIATQAVKVMCANLIMFHLLNVVNK